MDLQHRPPGLPGPAAGSVPAWWVTRVTRVTQTDTTRSSCITCSRTTDLPVYMHPHCLLGREWNDPAHLLPEVSEMALLHTIMSTTHCALKRCAAFGMMLQQLSVLNRTRCSGEAQKHPKVTTWALPACCARRLGTGGAAHQPSLRHRGSALPVAL